MRAEESRDRMRAEVTATLREIHGMLTDEDRELLATADDYLYDEYGLPK